MGDDLERFDPFAEQTDRGYRGTMRQRGTGKWVRLSDVALLRMQAEHLRRELAERRAKLALPENGWKAGAAQERRIWEEAVKLSLGTIPEGLRNALEQVRAGVEGDHD